MKVPSSHVYSTALDVINKKSLGMINNELTSTRRPLAIPADDITPSKTGVFPMGLWITV